jgi:hypothetical protein
MDLDRALDRVLRFMLALTAVGAVALCVSAGWRGGAGFLLGALVSYFNFLWLKRAVDALGGTAQRKPPRLRMAVLTGLRYLLLGGAAYVILRVTNISLGAALWGLFVPAAAVVVEIIYELVYART